MNTFAKNAVVLSNLIQIMPSGLTLSAWPVKSRAFTSLVRGSPAAGGTHIVVARTVPHRGAG